MKLIHLSDLHLGKRVNAFSMLEDQNCILNQILRQIDDEQPDAVLIAGDVYDKPVPSAEAVQLFDRFLVELSVRQLQVFLISGNHDSAERLAFGGRLMDRSGIHVSPVYDGTVAPVTLHDAYGVLQIYLLPFVKPAHVRRFYPEEEIESYTDAMRVAIRQMAVDPAVRNLLVTHQFVTGASRSESEELSVGGTDNVDAEVFAGFDYVALGHLHSPQNVGSPAIRYCGTPLAYSFSEAGQEKSVTVVELAEKGSLTVRTLPLCPPHPMRQLRGSYAELSQPALTARLAEAYLHITLTDEEDIPDAIGKLRLCYPKLMKLDYDNQRTRAQMDWTGATDVEEKTPLALFSEFYEMQNNQPMSELQREYIRALMEAVWEVGE